MADREDVRKFAYIFLAISIVTLVMYLIINRIPQARELREKIFRPSPSDSKSIEI